MGGLRLGKYRTGGNGQGKGTGQAGKTAHEITRFCLRHGRIRILASILLNATVANEDQPKTPDWRGHLCIKKESYK